MLVPFYVPGRDRLRIVIVGGGYSGLAALVGLREHRADAQIVLVDPRPDHLKITGLHETFRRPLADFRVPFPVLEKRFGFRHVQTTVRVDESRLKHWNANRVLTLDGEVLEFDYLVVATGAQSRRLPKADAVLDLDDFAAEAGSAILQRLLLGAGHREPWLTVVGGGPTGIQFLFEIASYLRDRRMPCHLRLVDAEPTPLAHFPSKLGRYVEARLDDLDIEYRPDCMFRSQESGRITLARRKSGETIELDSALTILLVGKSAKNRLKTNLFGQVVVGRRTLERVYAAGDCSDFDGPGSNAMTAQSALRKGRLVARNILRGSGPVALAEPYLHRDLGYVISMGVRDAVGWIALKRNLVGGLPAKTLKDIVDSQYDLFLDGIDAYVI